MNLADALAHVAAMTPAEKAAWDQANGFTPEAVREGDAIELLAGITVSFKWDEARPTIDQIVAFRDMASGTADTLDDVLQLLGAYDEEDRNDQPAQLRAVDPDVPT